MSGILSPARGESIIAQSGAATRRNSGYKSQKELEPDEAELRRPTAVLRHPSPPYFIFVENLRNYLIATQQYITRLPRLGAPVSASRCARLLRRGRPLRYGPRHCLSASAASLTLRRSGLNLFLFPHPRLRRFAACLGLLCFRPASRGSEFGGRAPAIIPL